jgi:haloalkane dehalogenase
MSGSRKTPEWLDTAQYPFESKYFRVSAGAMHYVDEGHGDPVVFVHGNPDWSFSYRKQIKALSGSHRCIAVDHIGFGLSDKPEHWSYLPKDHAQNFSEFMESLDLHNVTLVVNDWGGPIGKFLTTNWNFFARVILKKAYAVKSRLTPAIHKHYLEPLAHKSSRKGNWVFPREIIGSSEWLSELWMKFPAISTKPTLILWGNKDIAFKAPQLDFWRSILSHAEVHTFDDAGHYHTKRSPKR